MNYTAEHIDTEKFEAGLDSHKRYQEELQRTAIEKANARYEGYCQCLEDVRSMLHCSNYEKTDGLIPESIETGYINAIYTFAKLGGVECEDIANSNLPSQEKAKSVWDRIWKKMHKKYVDEGIKNRTQDYTFGINQVLSEIYGAFGIKPSTEDLCCRDGEDPTSYAKLLAERIKKTLCEETLGKINWVSVQESFPTTPKEKVAQGDREVKVLVWDGSELDRASYLPGLKNFFDLADEPIFGVTHWAIFDPPKNENLASIGDSVEKEESNGVD